MNIMIAYDNSRNARKALDATLDMFGPLKPLIMLVGVVEETRDTSDSAVELYERERNEFRGFLQEAADKVSAFGLDADVILAPYRDEYYNADSRYQGLAELLVLKNRQGASGGFVPMSFQGEYTAFGSIFGEWPEEPAESGKTKRKGRWDD